MLIRALVKSAEELETDKVPKSVFVPPTVHGSLNSAEPYALEDDENSLQPLSPMLQINESDESYHAPFSRLTSYEQRSYNKSITYDAHLATDVSFRL